MGLLDDAIREHLELKRRHGAGEDEVSKLETEVFGGAPAPPAPELGREPEVPVAAEPEPEPETEPEPEPETEPETEPVGFTDEEPWLDEPDEVPAGEALDHGRQATQEFEPEFVAPDEEPVGEDVLEETPEFLQETPEHDRLWFEQKPPRGFDFGGS